MSYVIDVSNLTSAEGLQYYRIDYPLATTIEKAHCNVYWQYWFEQNWSYCLYIIAAYIATIFGI